MIEPTTTALDYAALDAETRIVVQQRTTEIKALMKRAASDIIEIGQKLIEVKAKLPHGAWLPWLRSEFAWSADTAGRFMAVARRIPDIPHGAEFDARALYLLAAPSTPQSVRDEMIEDARTGTPITLQAVQQAVETIKPPRVCIICGRPAVAVGSMQIGGAWHCAPCASVAMTAQADPRPTSPPSPPASPGWAGAWRR